MSFLSGLFGGTTAAGVSATLNGVGDAAIKLREAITGDLPPEKKAELELRYAELEKAITEARSNVIMAEAQGQSWLQRNWRPITMITFLVLVCLDSFGVLAFRLSSQAWTLLQIGLGVMLLGERREDCI